MKRRSPYDDPGTTPPAQNPPSRFGSLASNRTELEAQRALTELLTRLEEPLRTTLVRHFHHGLEADEIAELEGVPAATVRARIAHGLDILRVELEQRHGTRRSNWLAFLLPFGLVSAPRAALRSARALAGSTLVLVTVFLAAATGLTAWILVQAPPTFAARRMRTTETRFDETARLDTEALAQRATAAPSGEHVAVAAHAEPAAAPARIDGETIRLVARVVDADDAPITGARVVLHAFAAHLAPALQPSTFTDGAGRIALDFLFAPGGEEGDVSYCIGRLDEPALAVEAEGYLLHEQRVALKEGTITNAGTIVLKRARTVTGRVVDERGQPLAGVRVLATRGGLTAEQWNRAIVRAGSGAQGAGSTVSVIDWLDEPLPAAGADGLRETRTDAAGEYELGRLPGGGHHIAFESAGRARVALGPVFVGAECGATDFVRAPDTVLGPDARWLWLRVRTAEGRPAAYSHVALARAGGPSVFAGYSNEAGELSLWLGDADPRDVFVTGAARAGTQVLRSVQPAGQPIEVVLDAPRFVHLKVVDERGEPRLNAWLGFHVDGRPWTRHLPDVESTFVLRLPASPFDVELVDAGGEPMLLEGVDPALVPERWEIVLREHAVVRGQLFDEEGAPLDAGVVRIGYLHGIEPPPAENGFPTRLFPVQSADWMETGPDGVFVLTRRLPGPFVLQFASIDGNSGVSGPYTVDAGRDLDGVELHLGAKGTIAGRVRCPAGIDPEGLLVGASCGDRAILYTRIDADGRFEFPNFPPGPWWLRRVIVERNGHVHTPARTSPATRVDLPAGGRVEVELDLAHDLPADVVGVATLDGQALGGWTAALHFAHPALDCGTSVRADGRFELRAEFREPARLSLCEPGAPRAQRTFERALDFSSAGEERVPLVARTARFAGRLDAWSGRALALVVELPGGWRAVTRFRAAADGSVPEFRAAAGPGVLRALDAAGEPTGPVLQRFDAAPDADIVLAAG
ncbi:MAG: hypothetical protein IPJ77_18685 [Planctomycetes bacterium]|nr:hypothetical protein [Planctomycetota bacterium]